MRQTFSWCVCIWSSCVASSSHFLRRLYTRPHSLTDWQTWSREEGEEEVNEAMYVEQWKQKLMTGFPLRANAVKWLGSEQKQWLVCTVSGWVSYLLTHADLRWLYTLTINTNTNHKLLGPEQYIIFVLVCVAGEIMKHIFKEQTHTHTQNPRRSTVILT